jgi:uncharacterized membrane protein
LSNYYDALPEFDQERSIKKAVPIVRNGLIDLIDWILAVVAVFIFERSQGVSVICLSASKVIGMVSVWPVDNLFAFLNLLFTGMTSAGEAGCHLSWIL